MYFSWENLRLPVLALAYALAVLCVWPVTAEYFPLWIFAGIAKFADLLFHQLGHSFFSFLYGIPNLPSVFTLFTADRSGDIIFMFERRWLLQIIVFCGLGFVCYYLYSLVSRFYALAVVISILILLTAFTSLHDVIIDVMGHGSAIIGGAVLLYLSFRHDRPLHRRCFDGFFGLFILLFNIRFCYTLSMDEKLAGKYTGQMAGNIFHHDLSKLPQLIGMSVQNAAVCFVIFGVLAMLTAAGYAFYRHFTEKTLNLP